MNRTTMKRWFKYFTHDTDGIKLALAFARDHGYLVGYGYEGERFVIHFVSK